MSLTLVVQDKEGNTTQYPVDAKPEVVLGRAAEVDVPLLSKNVSRKHAKVRFQGKKILIEDLGSSNGVLLNGAKIAGPTEVFAGSEFQIGEFTVKITSHEPVVPEGPLGTLTGQNGTFLDKVLPVKSGDNIVGRGSECDVFVADGSISRKHAILSISADKITVRDMGSANGTFVNGQRIQEITAVRHGEVVRFGSLSFRFELSNAQPLSMAASAPQPIAAKKSAPQPIAQPSAPQNISKLKNPSAKTPIVGREPSGAAAIKPATPLAPSYEPSERPDWLKVGVLLATPLVLAFFLGVVGWRLFGGSAGDDLAALRAQMATNAGVESAIALKGQKSFVEAEAALMPILNKNPGEPTARALYNTVHDEAGNQRALQDANSLKEQQDITGAIAKLGEIGDSSVFSAEAKMIAAELQKSALVSTMRSAAEACEAGNYSDCLDRICAYINETSETDPDILNLARIAYGFKLQSSGPSESCVKDPIQATQADKGKADAEKLYASDPRKDFVLAYFNGQAAQETATQLQEAAVSADSASNKRLYEDAAAALNSIAASLDAFSKRLEANNLEEAAKFAKSILDNEQKLFKNIESPVSVDVRRQLLTAYSKDFAMRTFSSEPELKEGKSFIRMMASIDTNNNSPLRFAMAVRYQAALREIFEKFAGREDRKGALEALLPFLNNKSKLKTTVVDNLSELSPK